MKRRSLVLITVDCLRADHVGFLGYQRATSPCLDHLAKASTVFQEAVATGSPTYYSFPGIMASRYPLALGRETIGLWRNESTLATCLKNAGYRTAAFTAGNPYLSRRFGYDSGFDHFEDFLHPRTENPLSTAGSRSAVTYLNQQIARACHRVRPLRAAYNEAYFRYTSWKALNSGRSLDQLRPYPSADTVVDAACEFLKMETENPVFLWLHLMDAHAPYSPPPEALALMGKRFNSRQIRYLNLWWNRNDLRAPSFTAHLEDVIDLYDAGIRWVDSQIQRLCNQLRALRRWDNCVLAVTADHGEEFLDHGGRFHRTTSLAQELIRVPLLIHEPDDSAHHVTTPFSLLNLAPTLLNSLGVGVPRSFRGRAYPSHVSDDDEIAISECVTDCNNPWNSRNRIGPRLMSLRLGQHQLVVDFQNAADRLFDLERDPGELHPLPRDHSKPIRCRLLEAARRHVSEASSSNAELKISARINEMGLQSVKSDVGREEYSSPALLEAPV
jgi:arylsulfatase A-like enzyme